MLVAKPQVYSKGYGDGCLAHLEIINIKAARWKTSLRPLAGYTLLGADDEARTRYLHLGKVALYQMSYIRVIWCLRAESNHRHGDFQSPALPTELQRQKEMQSARKDIHNRTMATRMGLEPTTSSVTG